MKEVFKHHPLNEFILVGNKGTVKSYLKKNQRRNSKKPKLKRPRILKPFLWNGYWKLGMGFVHQLVAQTWLERPDSKLKLEVHHKDSNRKNNKVNNLEYVTHSYNVSQTIKNECKIAGVWYPNRNVAARELNCAAGVIKRLITAYGDKNIPKKVFEYEAWKSSLVKNQYLK